MHQGYPPRLSRPHRPCRWESSPQEVAHAHPGVLRRSHSPSQRPGGPTEGVEDKPGLGQEDTHPLARKGHLWVGGDGELGESLGCLRLPHVGAFQGQWEQSLWDGPISTQGTARTVRPEALTVPPLPLPSVSPGLTTHPLTPSHFLGPPASYPDASGNTYKGLDMDCATHRAMKVNDTGALRALQAQSPGPFSITHASGRHSCWLLMTLLCPHPTPSSAVAATESCFTAHPEGV